MHKISCELTERFCQDPLKYCLEKQRLTDVCKDIKHFEDWFTSIEARQGVYKNL